MVLEVRIIVSLERGLMIRTGQKRGFCFAAHVLLLDLGSAHTGMFMLGKLIVLHSYDLCTFLNLSFSTKFRYIKVLTSP